MTETTRRRVPKARSRTPLSRERVLRAAIALADEGGIEAISMRRLGRELRVEAMSLYRHVASKDDILDGIADLVTSEFEVPSGAADWKTAIRRSVVSAHEALLRHPWASSVIESRLNSGPARLRYLDAVIGVLSGAGFSMPDVARAFVALDSHTYGFTLQEQSWAIDVDHAPEAAATLARALPTGEYPNLVAMAEMVMTAPDGVPLDFEFGLNLILDGLDRLRETA
jgi:AcrR family transcriptional regulator